MNLPLFWDHLPRHNGLPVPFFTAVVDGRPDFLVVDPARVLECARRHLCGICGRDLGYWVAFIGGPQTLANRYTSESPLHEECAAAALTVCPYLAGRSADRRAAGLPDGHVSPAGGIRQRPDRVAVIVTRGFEYLLPPGGGVGFRFRSPSRVAWHDIGKDGAA